MIFTKECQYILSFAFAIGTEEVLYPSAMEEESFLLVSQSSVNTKGVFYGKI